MLFEDCRVTQCPIAKCLVACIIPDAERIENYLKIKGIVGEMSDKPHSVIMSFGSKKVGDFIHKHSSVVLVSTYAFSQDTLMTINFPHNLKATPTLNSRQNNIKIE